MRRYQKVWTSIITFLAFLVLIIDTKTAINGARDGVDICVKSVIPSLFPFFLISSLISNLFNGQKIPLVTLIANRLRIPSGNETLFLFGLLSGYPIGAMYINDAYRERCLAKSDAHRMLAFCNNAGPAFIFGILSIFFSNKLALWALWGIHILSAFTVGILLPGSPESIGEYHNRANSSITNCMERSIRSIATVCGWVIVFRIIISIVREWTQLDMNSNLYVILAGVIELSNGCLVLCNIHNLGLRFIVSACFLAFGGICVAMQTISVTKDVGIGLYFPGKLLQTAISLLFAHLLQPFILPRSEIFVLPIWLQFFCIILILGVSVYMRKRSSILVKSVV